jgi:hypothetical protein
MIALPVAEPGEPKRQRLARAIFLPKLPGSGGVPGLLVKSEGTSVGSEFAAPYQGRMTLMRVAGIAERYASCDLYLLEPIGASARDEEMPQAASRAHSVST